MNTEAASPASTPAPPLCLALWSLRRRMRLKPIETLPLIKKWGFSTVELAGFFHLDPITLAGALKEKKQKLRVCSMHAPPLCPDRQSGHYSKWAEEYLTLFDTRELVLQSSAQSFPEPQEGKSSKEANDICDKLVDLIVQIAKHMDAHGNLVSYHCYTHDFTEIEGQSLVSRLFARKDLPNIFGLQLDTFWLHNAGIEPHTYASWPVHSVHLNERDHEGRCCVLGTAEDKCTKYIRPLLGREPPVNWILENDPCVTYEYPKDGDMIRTIKGCVTQWPRFWDSLVSSAQADVNQEVL